MSDIRILVVDDEEDITELIRYNLVSDGYIIKCAYSGEEAVKFAVSEPFDLIVLDLMLPGISGIDVAKRLKSDSKTVNIPIIMLTAKSEEADIISGLQLADDYVTKPFSPKILSARINAILRRRTDGSADNYNDETIRRGDILIYPKKRKVEVSGKPVELSFSEFQILTMLSKRPGWVFSRSQIVDSVHGEDYPVTDRSVDVQIVGLRKKLGHCGKYIETVRSVGYRFKEKL